MNYQELHWVWYLLGILLCPRFTIAIAVTLYGSRLGIPVGLIAIVWLIALFVK